MEREDGVAACVPHSRRTSKDLRILPEPHLDITSSSRPHFASSAPRRTGVACVTLWWPCISSFILESVILGLFYSSIQSHQPR
jgi:hypothetical protein